MDKYYDGNSEDECKKPNKKGLSKAEEEEQRLQEKVKWNEYDCTKSFEERVKVCTRSPMSQLREEVYL